MKKTLDIKKLILLNMPYILMGLFATNFGEAWRMAQGADASEKFLSLVAVLPGALQSFWPSLHPLDLLVGLCCGVGLRLAGYFLKKKAPNQGLFLQNRENSLLKHLKPHIHWQISFLTRRRFNAAKRHLRSQSPALRQSPFFTHLFVN